MTDTPTPAPAPASPETPQAEYARLRATVSTNPAQVEFPRDVWGMTTELRKAGLRAASSIRGDAEKQLLFLTTLAILGEHAKARLADDQAIVATRSAAIQSTHFNDRVYATNVPAPKTEPAVPTA